MKTTLWIEHKSSDRNIILTSEGGALVGINYWQGIDDDCFSEFKYPNEELTQYILPKLAEEFGTQYIQPSADYDEMVKYIDDLIWAFVRESEESLTITIPADQLNIVRNALIGHLATLERILQYPTESQAHEMFDLHTLSSLMKYDVKVTLTKQQVHNFTKDNGVDLPQYI